MSVNEIKDVPQAFKDWVSNNSDRIAKAEKRGTLPYFVKDNKTIIDGIRRNQTKLNAAYSKFKSYDTSKWKPTYSNDSSHGFVVTEKGRIASSQINKQEIAKYAKEVTMCKVFADGGKRIEHLAEVPGVSSADVTINGIAVDLKKLSSANNIARHAKYATNKQGAKQMLFQFDVENEAIYAQLQKLKRSGISGY